MQHQGHEYDTECLLRHSALRISVQNSLSSPQKPAENKTAKSCKGRYRKTNYHNI